MRKQLKSVFKLSGSINTYWTNAPKLQLLMIPLLCVLGSTSSQAQIYKWTDAQGVIHFSDHPHPGSETVKIPGAQSYSPPNSEAGSSPDEPVKAKSDDHVYTKIFISQPINESTVRNNQGYVVVAVQLEPELFSGDKLQMIFDGSPLGDPQANTLFQLSGIYRGSHTLAVQVLDATGTVLSSSDPITFFMHRPRVGMVKKSGI